MAALDLPDLLTRAAGSRPDRVAVVEPGGRRLTWSELDREVTRLAGGLVAEGVVAGTRVLLALGNRLEMVTAYLAVLRAQAVAVPVDPEGRAEDLATVLADSGSRYAVTDARAVDALRSAPGAPLLVVTDDVAPVAETERRFAALAGDGPLPPLLDPERLAVLLYTSGTSGPPRGVMLSHRALAANLEQVGALEPPLTLPDDVVLGVLPLFHVYGLAAVLGGVLRQASTLVLVQHFVANQALDQVAHHHCTVVPVAPRALERWLAREDLADRMSGVRLVLSGSAQVDRVTWQRFQEAAGVPVHQGYGLTEAAPVVTSTAVSGVDGGSPAGGSLGLPIPGVEMRVLDDHGDPVEPGDPGEIEIRGANLFSGYWPDGDDGPAADGWWPTGDLGVLDDAGSLSLVDRVRETIVVAGFSVYPQEVEDALRQVPGVADVAVIAGDDEADAVVAYVVPGGGGESADELRAAVEEHAATALASFKRPRRIEVVDRLPVGVTGRVQKGRLRHLERRRALGLLA
ncbi:class I adenylate-forming enzyme family protein [Nocardioides sp.]|uniref:class I adenylate-forming enzyme family protein n=1 Tax=Nocardioides sp. TaxID=35761 RepID=UPI0035299F8B